MAVSKFDPEILKILYKGDRAERVLICEEAPIYYAAYHFPEFFRYPTAPFHFDFADDYKCMVDGDIDLYAWIAFRESAKTSYEKILMTHAINYRKKRFINYDSYDKENAEAALFDVANWLMTKESLIEDYGPMLKPSKRKGEGGKTIQRLSKFITTYYNPDNDYLPEVGTMVQAFSTQEPVRGRVFNEMRPDWLILDDIETNKTKESRAAINSIIAHFNEARTGLQGGIGAITVLGNYIIDDGAIGYIIEQYKNNSRARIRNIPAIIKGEPAWPGKYVLTNKEAMEVNADIPEREKKLISLEAKREEYGDTVFATEMMNDPAKSGDLFFERRLVDFALEKCIDPIDHNADLKIWAKFNPSHSYGMGADTAEGIGSDSNSSVIIDFKVRPNLVVATFEDNQLAPNVFGAELAREGKLYGYPFLVPEINQTGYATIAELVNEPEYPYIYQREVFNKTSGKTQKEYGFKSTTGTKWQVLGEFKSAFEDGELQILDRGLLEEMRLFRKQDARIANRDKGATKHFDKLRAAAYAWHARGYAIPPKAEQDKKFFNIPGQKEPYRP